MIVGSGSVAKMLNDRDGALFFAAGVSNSNCQDYNEFSREIELLRSMRQYDYLSLFYFSTINSNESLKPYFIHKWDMEERVKHWFKNYNIIRLGNIWECTNPNTFRNYIKDHPDTPIRDEYKYMISKEQLLLITDNLPLKGKNEISIFGTMKKVRDCI